MQYEIDITFDEEVSPAALRKIKNDLMKLRDLDEEISVSIREDGLIVRCNDEYHDIYAWKDSIEEVLEARLPDFDFSLSVDEALAPTP